MISILLPVRLNSPVIKDCLDSILETATGTDFEILLSLSDKDTWIPELPNVRYFYQDKSLGRYGLHEYMNLLAKEAKGDLLWHLCDDYRILTPGWDQILKKYEELSNGIFYFLPTNQANRNPFGAPMITRKWIDTTKHWALSYSVDSWVGEIAYSHLPDNHRLGIIDILLEDLQYSEDSEADPVKIEEFLKTRKWELPLIRKEIQADAKLLEQFL